jgi:putative DNA primase/helicase
MTGGDPITARFLYGEYFDYIPAYKVWLAVNHKPVIKGTDEGIWRRIRLIPFEASFKANPDPYLEDKLKAELEGILRWAINGCLEWHKERLTMAGKVKNATEEYRQESDAIAQFLAECTVEAENATVMASKLYKAYEAWCDTNGEDAISGNSFGRRLTEKGYEKKRLAAGLHYLQIGLLAQDE